MVGTHPFLLAALAAAVARVGSAVDSCVQYKHYFQSLDYCAEPLYWSNYPISTNVSVARAEAAAQAEYESVRDNVYYDVYNVQEQANVNKAQLADCLGYARRVACHRAFPRCESRRRRGRARPRLYPRLPARRLPAT
jgi:hypothetical protein